MNPQLRPLDSDANLDIFWPHFVSNSSACTSWLWIGIRYLSNWNKFKHLTWNIKFYKYSYSHSISTDYSIITGGVTIFFSQASTKKHNLNWTNLFANGSSGSASENDQSFIFHNRWKQNKHLWWCLWVQKPNTMNHWLLSIALVDCFSLQSCSGILEFKVRSRSYQSYLWLRPCIALSPYLEQRCWEALSRLEPIIHSMYGGTLLCCKVTRNMIR